MRAAMIRLLVVVFLALAGGTALLWLLQGRLIYFPRRYGNALASLPAGVERLSFAAASGTQTAFYVPATVSRRVVWILFGGNAMTALDWLDWVAEVGDPGAAFLLVDYPGYGASDGVPSRRAIRRTTAAAFDALAARLGIQPAELAAETYLLGHSIGAAAALDLAVARVPRGIVLTAPFTSVRAVAREMFGRWAVPLVREDYDNAARLAELGALGERRPRVAVLHGRRDEIIPFAHGERLAAGAPWVRFVAVPGAGHNDIYLYGGDAIRAAMRELAPP